MKTWMLCNLALTLEAMGYIAGKLAPAKPAPLTANQKPDLIKFR
jgi:hypothetical protein